MTLFRLAAALCFFAVALGAFGAHSLKATLQVNAMIDVWNKAVLYHLAHAVALVALALHGPANRVGFGLLVAGIAIFSGSLYLLAVSGTKILGAITPIGGLAFIAGWIVLAIDLARTR